MGRYYSGDIEGKFWFAVQDSDDAENFGAVERDDRIDYYIPNEAKDGEVKDGIKECLDELGEFKERLDKFFEKTNLYNDRTAAEFWKDEYDEVLKPEMFNSMIVIYARLSLGRKIEAFFKENPEDDCYFEADN
jgi:hypothetical protein